jgi:hypothetical protein
MRLFYRVTVLAAVGAIAAAEASAQDVGRFSGSLRATNPQGVSEPSHISGTVDVTPSAKGTPGVWKIEIKLSSRGASSMSSNTGIMQWSISPGRCGSAAQFLVPPNELPALEIRSGGNADAMWEGAVVLAPSGSYQVMIYDKGLREQDQVACANLRFSAPKK